MVARTGRNIWRSKRLIFRPAEPTDEPFLQSINNSGTSDTFQNAAPFLPVPQGSAAAAKGYREYLEKCLLGCIVCLPPPIAPETTAAIPADAAAAVAATKPIPIGTISLMNREVNQMHHRNTSLGITLAPAYQGQGYGSEILLWTLEWAFRHANLHRVEIGAFAYNEGAWKLYQRLGFVEEGRKREAIWYDGAYRDCVEMAMLRREWEERYGERKDE